MLFLDRKGKKGIEIQRLAPKNFTAITSTVI